MTPRYMVINNFDAAGGNVSLVLHDAPPFAMQQPPFQPDERPHHVVVTSGRTATSHEANKRRLHQYLAQHPDTPLADLAYITTARRMHHVHRDAYVVASNAELLHQLQQQQSATYGSSEPKPASSAVFTFTGPGQPTFGHGRHSVPQVADVPASSRLISDPLRCSGPELPVPRCHTRIAKC